MILMIKKYATLFKWGGILLVLGVIMYWVYDYSQSKERLGNLIVTNKQLSDTVENIQNNITKQKLEIIRIRNNYSKIESLYTRQVEEINELRILNDQYLIDNKPKVEVELNTKFKSTQDRIMCATGDKTKC